MFGIEKFGHDAFSLFLLASIQKCGSKKNVDLNVFLYTFWADK